MTATVTEIPRADLTQGELIASVITQLDDAGEFLATTPGVKVSPFCRTAVLYFAAMPAEVDEIAAAIGGTAGWNADRTQYGVERRFGPEVSYRAVYIRQDSEDRTGQPEGAAA